MPARRVLQFKVSLLEVHPAVWRRISISSDATFWDLHIALQDVLGWSDYHLHDFIVPANRRDKHFGIPSSDLEGASDLAGWEHRVTDHITPDNPTFTYRYDFGDDWHHEVVFEGKTALGAGQRLPICIDGEGSCPPEDCGGPSGYAELFDALRNPDYERHDEMVEWMGARRFDLWRLFDPENVGFSDPRRRLLELQAHIAKTPQQ